MITLDSLRGSLPAKVTLVEVCPRDGLQNLKNFIPTQLKMRLVDALLEAGLSNIEVTSFVSPKAIPQMVDAAAVAAHALEKAGPGVRITALAPNTKGAEAAWNVGIREINYVMSMSEAHNKANINRTCQESLDALEAIIQAFPEMRVNLAAATAFGCPFDGEVPVDVVLGHLHAVAKLGVQLFTLSDTIGVANPAQVMALVEAVQAEFPTIEVGLHMHDTHGTGVANAFAGLLAGVRRFEGATGGLGGCPFAPGAAGNTATEDMVNLFTRMGIDTGINLARLIAATAMIRNEQIAPAATSHLGSARSYEEFRFFKP